MVSLPIPPPTDLRSPTWAMQTSLESNAVSGFAVAAARLTFSGTMQTLRAWQPARAGGPDTLKDCIAFMAGAAGCLVSGHREEATAALLLNEFSAEECSTMFPESPTKRGKGSAHCRGLPQSAR